MKILSELNSDWYKKILTKYKLSDTVEKLKIFEELDELQLEDNEIRVAVGTRFEVLDLYVTSIFFEKYRNKISDSEKDIISLNKNLQYLKGVKFPTEIGQCIALLSKYKSELKNGNQLSLHKEKDFTNIYGIKIEDVMSYDFRYINNEGGCWTVYAPTDKSNNLKCILRLYDERYLVKYILNYVFRIVC